MSLIISIYGLCLEGKFKKTYVRNKFVAYSAH